MISKILSKRSHQNMFSTTVFCRVMSIVYFMMLRGEINMQLFKVTVSLFCRDVGILDDYFYFGFLSQLVNCMNKSLILKRCLQLTVVRPHASWYINTNHRTWQGWTLRAAEILIIKQPGLHPTQCHSHPTQCHSHLLYELEIAGEMTTWRENEVYMVVCILSNQTQIMLF